jgi:hypothetical protein
MIRLFLSFRQEDTHHADRWPAIAAFVPDFPAWFLLKHYLENNGLTVRCRQD